MNNAIHTLIDIDLGLHLHAKGLTVEGICWKLSVELANILKCIAYAIAVLCLHKTAGAEIGGTTCPGDTPKPEKVFWAYHVIICPNE